MDESPTAAAAADQRSGAFLLLPLYIATIFTSAALLFVVQPMFTKMVLPRLGGTPAVWSVAMVFFQTVLLGGYAYAHGLARFVSLRLAVAIHLLAMLSATIFLPLRISASWGDPPTSGEAFWLVGLFGASMGVPFFALSANGPLLQAWFARTGHRDAKDPYFLYAASNIGSFLALLGYPVLIEPFLTLGQQTALWTWGFWLLIALIAVSGLVVLSRDDGASLGRAAPSSDGAEAAPSLRGLAVWVGLGAVPSGLLVAVTAHISTDVAAVPFLWVVPLSLYLLTFVIVFQRRPLVRHRAMVAAQPFVVTALLATMIFVTADQLLINLPVHLFAFFVSAMVCHGELARRRPAARHLTVFYLALSLGGMLGGLFAGLIAPFIFSWIAEYPILIVLALFCRPGGLALPASGARLAAIATAGAAALVLLPGLAGLDLPGMLGRAPLALGASAVLTAVLFLRGSKLALAASVAFVLVALRVYPPENERQQTVRSFFGVHKVAETKDGRFRILYHGVTIHGAQRLREKDGKPATGRPEPLTYYFADSPLAQAIAAARQNKAGALRVAVIGLGAGALACYAKPGDSWTFFEIDPEVVRIARDPARFRFLSECLPDAPMVLGDARLTLAKRPDAAFDLIVVDAFSSDAIPVHLLTKEAMSVYLSKLAPGGLIAMHISNKHMELATVAVGIAAANGLVTYTNDTEEEDEDEFKFDSTVAVVARSEAELKALPADDWSIDEPDPADRVWTDDYSNVLGAIIENLKE